MAAVFGGDAEVRAYFADRPQDMVEIELGAPDSWERLCKLLDAPVPEMPWPHSNAIEEQIRKGSGLLGLWNRSSLYASRLKDMLLLKR